jgi:F-type H+-transporting ATPase subunit gamma
VQNTRKVTRALEMVSASKIRKAQERMKARARTRALMTQLIGHLAKANSEYQHPFMVEREESSASATSSCRPTAAWPAA